MIKISKADIEYLHFNACRTFIPGRVPRSSDLVETLGSLLVVGIKQSGVTSKLVLA